MYTYGIVSFIWSGTEQAEKIRKLMVSVLPMQAFYYAIVNGDEEQFVSDLRGLKREGSRPTVKMEVSSLLLSFLFWYNGRCFTGKNVHRLHCCPAHAEVPTEKRDDDGRPEGIQNHRNCKDEGPCYWSRCVGGMVTTLPLHVRDFKIFQRKRNRPRPPRLRPYRQTMKSSRTRKQSIFNVQLKRPSLVLG